MENKMAGQLDDAVALAPPPPLIEQRLRERGRRLNDSQAAVVGAALKQAAETEGESKQVKACTMLYVKLVEELAFKLPSWKSLSIDEVPPTVPRLIDNLYRDLENEVRACVATSFGSCFGVVRC